jgi:hypothetical protein
MLASQKSKEGSRAYGVELLGGYCGVHENINMLSRCSRPKLLRLAGLLPFDTEPNPLHG